MPNDLAVTPTELNWLTIADAARLIESRRLSPLELTDALLARIDALDPQLNAFLLPTPEKARGQAKAAEREIIAGRYRGPLHGIRFGLKDIYATAGIRTTSHSKICENLVPTEDATTAAKLYQAGGVLLGKLATHEFAHGGPSFELGPLVAQFEGTLDQFSGDGIMVFFNDPIPCPDPAERAVRMAMAMREAGGKLITVWRRHGCELGFGAGIAQGYATLGQIGFSERFGYTAIGTVCNLAARLCAEAKDGQILMSSRIAEAVEAVVRLEDLGNLELKGLRRPVAAFDVAQSTSAGDARPNLTVVARGPEA